MRCFLCSLLYESESKSDFKLDEHLVASGLASTKQTNAVDNQTHVHMVFIFVVFTSWDNPSSLCHYGEWRSG